MRSTYINYIILTDKILIMNKFHILIFFAALFILIGCKDDPQTIPTPVEIEDEWPEFVDTGANMVAYKVDGKIRVVKNISKTDPNKGFLSCFYFLKQQNKRFAFEGDRISDEKIETIKIDIDNLEEPGIYKIGGNIDLFNNGSYFAGPYHFGKQYTTNELDSGIISITKIDTIKGFITGTFEFNGEYVFGSNKVKITEGRFDLKYRR